MSKETICKNCSTEFSSKFCPDCGQKASVKRITMQNFMKEVYKKIFHWDNSLVQTTVQLVLSPGAMTRAYLSGSRVKYTKPINYLFIVMTLSILLVTEEQFMGISGVKTGDEAQKQAVMQWIFKHINLVFIALVPLLALFSKWMYRKSGFNYAEHLVFNAYVLAGQTLVILPQTAMERIGWINSAAFSAQSCSIIIAILYTAWAYTDFFNTRHHWSGGIKALLVYVLAMMAVMVLGIIVGIAVTFAYMTLFPDK